MDIFLFLEDQLSLEIIILIFCINVDKTYVGGNFTDVRICKSLYMLHDSNLPCSNSHCLSHVQQLTFGLGGCEKVEGTACLRACFKL